MPYELRRPGLPAETFDSEAQAVAAARALIVADADAEIDIIDLATGKPCAPGASGDWREELGRRVGF